MTGLLNSFWIVAPVSYVLTVGGLAAGFRRGSLPTEQRLPRALATGVPLMLLTWIVWTLIEDLVERPATHRQFATLSLLLGFVFTASSSALVGALMARRKTKSILERGTVLVGDAARESRATAPGTLTLAGYPLSPTDETKHFKMIGTTGTGKSTAIRELLTKALGRGDRAVIADPDGAYLDEFYDPTRGDVILNPFDARALRWDLFAEIIQPHDADQLARSLIPDYEGPDRHWRAYARTFLTALLRQLHRSNDHSLASLYATLVTSTIADLRDLLATTPAAPFLAKDNGKFFESVRSITIQHLAALEHLARQSAEETLSVRKWIRGGRGVLFLPYQASEIASLRQVISTWMRLAIFEAMSGKETDRKLWFVVDELDALGAIDGLKDALARLRKFGGRCVLGFQSIGQVRGTYGDTEAQTIVENCGNTLILRCSASERGGTAEFASRLIGKREVTRQQLSVSRPRRLFGFLWQTRTVSDQVATEDAVMAPEIEQLPDLCGFLKRASRPEWQRVNLASDRTAEPQSYGWEATAASLIGAAIATLGLVTHLIPPHVPDVDPKAASKLLAWQSPPARVAGPSTSSSEEGASPNKHHTHLPARRPSPPPDPHEVVIGPTSISGRFTLIGIDRKHVTPTSDELTLRLRLDSLAMADLVTPFQSSMLEVRIEGQDSIQPQHEFSHPVRAGDHWDQAVVFTIPSDMNLAHATLRVHYYPESKEIPLNLPPRADMRQKPNP